MIEVQKHLEQFIGLKDLTKLPESFKRWKCPICHCFGFTKPECPECGSLDVLLVCPLDHCHCSHTITEVLEYCPICEDPVCPVCGTHDVFQLSRVTGYIQDVGGWGNGKRQELKDRVRSNAVNGSWVKEGNRHIKHKEKEHEDH